ncbi:hypothetical protein EDD96_0150 [Streptomyces sp. Ag109_G2-6]|uniref:hypothetical protein n=1 Tax=Streptomyces sp. Ag109_G2-6 TaxID=2485154 RepID=UPI000C2C8F58|nr:hypothetical protein [Streptomyces sp. Ag109_G2-6]RPF43648.1 hypothetical protein EDD96_0150 [Streptomyces sp. Ag109_G2-6]
MAGDRETWTTEEFGTSHEGWVGVLLADGTVPAPALFDTGSGPDVHQTSHWSVYDGRFTHIPRAAALRGTCSCGWSGPEHPLDWDAIGRQDLEDAADEQADACCQEWDEHTTAVEAATIPLPESVTHLLEQLQAEIGKLGDDSPLAAVRAVRRLEAAARAAGYWVARSAQHDATPAQAATALGLTEAAARRELARLGRWSPYRS